METLIILQPFWCFQKQSK